MPNGHEYLMKASDEFEAEQWVSRINYASAFKTSGVRMRAMGMTGRQAISTGTAAAVSHVHDLARQSEWPPIRPLPVEGSDTGDDTDDASVDSPVEPVVPKGRMQRMTVHAIVGGVDLDHPASSVSDARLEDTFKEVKAELAGFPGLATNIEGPTRTGVARAVTLGGSSPDPPRLVSSPDMMESRSNLSTADEDGQEILDRPDHRATVISDKIRLLDSRIGTIRMALDADLRIARNLSVLTPFQRSTRERVRAAVLPIAKRVRQLRVDLHKLQCHRDTFDADLKAEENDWQRTKTMAMKAATKELRVRNDKRLNTVPGMQISVSVTDEPVELSPPLERGLNGGAESSSGSFYSATDEQHDASTSEGGVGLTTAHTPQFRATLSPNDFPLVDVDDASSGFPFPKDSVSPSPSSTPAISPVPTLVGSTSLTPASTVVTSEPGPEDEQAEDWDKTRCAKRVSLVTVSKEVEKYSVRLGRQVSEHLHIVGEEIDTHQRSKSEGH